MAETDVGKLYSDMSMVENDVRVLIGILEIATITAHRDGYLVACSKTSRTALV